MSTVKANNLQGGGGVNRNDKAAVQLSGSATLNVTGDFEMDNGANVVVPQGSDDQRPTPSAGQVRVNTTAGSGTLEGYNGTEWISLTAPPAVPIAGSSEDNPAESCYDMLTNDNITQNGFYWINSSGTSTLTWCFMEAPWGEPDYSLLTPYSDLTQSYSYEYGWYHTDNNSGNMTSAARRRNPGKEWFTYDCDGCAAADTRYNYPAPSGHVIHYYTARSHCGGNTSWGYPGQTNSCANQYSSSYSCNTVFRFAGVTTTNVGFEQHSDNCGDPNEATIVVVSKVQGTTRPAPSENTFKDYMRRVEWSNGGTTSRYA